MTTYYRRQTQAGGNYPPQPPGTPGVPFWPQTLPPSTVIGRSPGNAGPTEAIPFATLLASLTSALEVLTVTAAGVVTVLPTTDLLVLNKASASVTPVNLPTVFSRNKRPLWLFDLTGLAGDITLTPFGTEKVMGLSSWVIASGGVAGSGGSLYVLPLSDISGWLSR